MRTPHSSTNKGKRVKVTLRNGSYVIGKFSDKKSGRIILDEARTHWPDGEVTHVMAKSQYTSIPMGDVRAFSIYKPLK